MTTNLTSSDRLLGSQTLIDIELKKAGGLCMPRYRELGREPDVTTYEL